ncbi:2OG-Fe(II) oxygenase [Nocardia sp. NPDC049149]|uniref:2OG-Fe(II) oxygenase n=1 Tax=Nocardia sp. NPDC049149 TaxID=3364315 RepID=UPI003713043E
MHVTYKGSRVIVIDEVLAPSDATALWRWFQTRQLSPIAPGNQVGNVSDGFAYASTATVLEAVSPSEALVDRTLLQAAHLAEEVVGVAGQDWRAVGHTCRVHPVGSQLSWHNDGNPEQTGGFVWYVHPRWGASWGGELLVVDECASELVRQALQSGRVHPGEVESVLTTEAQSEVLFSGPDPLCFQARPNRIVFLANDTFHTVRRVDGAAGDRLRCTVVGFFRKAG